MTTPERSNKVAEIIKNADLYDLIKISMRSTDSKLSAVDRYIKRALDRQVNSSSIGLEANENYYKFTVNT
jgi:argonaute-like protein implicated in RNA metabolism and viral defense